MVTLETLAPRLRELRLSGMRTGIAARAEEARTRQLDPLEFFLLLLDDELARREADGVNRTIARARFEEACDLRDFDFSYNPQVPKARLWELASGRYLGEHAAVLLYGPTGVGKSFVAQARLRRYLAPELLILDDFAMREYTTAQAEDLYELVSRRYRKGALIATTNRDPKELYPMFPNPVIAEGLLDRLLNSAYLVPMLGKSYRPRQRPGSSPANP